MRRTFTNLALLAAGGAVGAHLIKRVVERRRHFEMPGRVAIVTGGSRGLGLVLARRLVEQGARVAICARTEADLDAAREELTAMGGDVLAVRCDVRDQHDVERMVDQVRDHFGDIDLLFNVAGVIQVGPLEEMTKDEFELAMQTNCWGTLHTVLAVLPTMRRSGWGRIVNIASLGGKRAVPHMLPYSASKFAVVGLSNGLRTELLEHGIYVTTACPSLMRTGSPRNAIFKGQHRKEYAWFSIGDSLPLVSMSAESAAEQILDACQNGRGEVIIRGVANLGVALQSALPGVTRAALGVVAGLLPEPGGVGSRPVRGYQSESGWSPSWLTQLTQAAARRNNELRPRPIDMGPSGG
ncbi:putative ketoacyl reductase [Posidoniimonas polymericola]|uniref:Putative ketoacyl reductase n=1 Tax=Posidoniimonas polymericola TaxID=2528002 RepID=A0A5C5YSR9_9BACT|nr:SDR family oxidoreductase [Posidoniimonas polymericola]TWT78042.1 putative ketoacyl reductase [Posidoniimonas polymericola]